MRWARQAIVASVLASACGWDVELAGTRFLCPDQRCPAGQRCEDGVCTTSDAYAPPPWWDPAWATRRRLVVTNGGAEPTPDGLPVVVHVTEELLGISDYVEANLARWDGAAWTRLTFYEVRQTSGTDALWFRLPAAIPAAGAEGSVWIYAGNPAPPGQLGGDDNFEQVEYFDDATLDPAAWAMSGDVTIDSGRLRIGTGGQVRSLSVWGPGHAVDVVVEMSTWSSRMWLGLQRSGDLTDTQPFARWAYGAGGLAPEVEVAAAQTASWTGAAVTAPTGRQELGVERFADRARFWQDSRPVDEHAFEAAYEPALQIRLGNTSSAPILVPSLRVRLAMDPAPEVVVGEAEERF